MPRRHAPRLVMAIVLGVALTACSGDPDTGQSPSPAATPSAVAGSSTTDTATATPTGEPTPAPSPSTTTEATPSPEPSPTPEPSSAPTAAGIDAPTAPPEEWSEFTVAPPMFLTEEYAAWVLVNIYRAEDALSSLIMDTPPIGDSPVPEDVTQRQETLYGGPSLAFDQQTTPEALRQPLNERGFVKDPGSTRLSDISLLDATQECLLVEYTSDSQEIVKQGGEASRRVALLEPKPERDVSGLQPTPWLLTNRAPIEDVQGRSCP